MKTQYKINKGQYLSDILPLIPSNTILYKKITGIGATTAEIKAVRHSIIVVPNKPVIDSKCKKHKNIIGVYEGVSTNEVINRLIADTSFHKIMVTPESYHKVKKACQKLNISLYSTFFMLCDEAHQYIDDADFRSEMIETMNDFFLFENKALVSATPIEFSDPRFVSQGFVKIEIIPTYNYRYNITAIHTNSIYMEIKNILHTSTNEICIFLNSVDMIHSLIEKLDIGNDCAVFCSEKGVRKFIGEYNFPNAYHSWCEDKMKRISFFTSRFYNAFDLELSYQPDVLLITDVFATHYTWLDLNTDCIQILGRFRNGINSAIHIFNSHRKIPNKDRDRIKWELSAHRHCYEVMSTYYENAATKEARFAFAEALKSIPFSEYISNGEINYFKIDNKIHNVCVQSTYGDYNIIESNYLKSDLFVLSFKTRIYPSDLDKLVISRSKFTIRVKRAKIVNILVQLKEPYSETDIRIITDIRAIDPFIVEAYMTLGKTVIEQLKYSEKKIKEALIMNKRNGMEVIDLIKNSFKIGCRYSNKFIVQELNRIYSKFDIYLSNKIRAKAISQFFEVIPCKVKKERGYYLIQHLV